MAHARTPPGDWIAAGLSALASGGPEAVRVEALARALGVTKGSFYWQFADRGALLTGLLDTWEQTMVDQVIDRVEALGGDGRTRLRQLFALASSVEIGDLMRTELAIREWARQEGWVAARLRGVDNRRMAYLRSLFGEFCSDPDEVEARCLIVMSLFIGNPFLAAEHSGRSRGEVIALVLRKLEG